MRGYQRALARLSGVLGLALVMDAALATYTFPGTSSLESRAVRSLIRGSLHASDSMTAVSLASVGLLPAGRPAPAERVEPVLETWRQATTYDPSVLRWAGRSADADSAGLRRWLSRWSFTARRMRDDTITITWHRLALGERCPLVSTLRATLVRRVNRGLHVARVVATCPSLAE